MITLSTSYLMAILALLLVLLVVLFIYIQNLRGKAQLKNSQLHRAFDKLKGREQTLSLIYENANDFIALIQVVDDDFIIAQLPNNFIERIERNTTFQKADVMGSSMDFLYREVLQLSEEEISWRFDKLKQVCQSMEVLRYEEHFKRPDSERGWAQSSLIPITDHGKCSFILYVARDISKEKRTREERDRTLKLFQSLVDNNPAAIILFNDEGEIEMVNKRFVEYYGYEPDEILGQRSSKIVPPEHHEMLNEVRKGVRDDFEVYQFGQEHNLKAMRKDGSFFNCELAICPVKIEEKLYAIAAVSDVTSYYNTQKELIDSKTHLQSIIDNLPGMIYRLHNDDVFSLKFISGNSDYYLGITQEEIKAQQLRPRDVIPTDFLEKVRSQLRYAVENDVRSEVTMPLIIKNKTKWVNTRFKPTHLENGEMAIDGLLLDVTQQVENQQRLELAIEGAGQGTWDWNIQTNEIVVNELQLKMIGFSDEEVSNNFEWWVSRVHPEDREPAYQTMIKHIKGQSEGFEAEYRLKTKNGGYKWIQVKGKVIERNAKGRATRALGIHLDINHRKKMELALRQSRSRLQALVSNLPGMVYRTSIQDDFAVVFASKGALKLTGYTSTDFTKGTVSLFKMMKPAYRDEVRREVEAAIREKRPYNLIYEIDTPGGTKWLYDKGQEFEDSFIEGFITDITERVEAEERIIQTIIETEDRERERIARELHDNLGQKLTTASLNFNALKSELNNNPDLFDRMSKGLGHLKDAIKDARDISHNLMPRSIEDFGFVLSVESLITDLNKSTDVHFEFYHNLKNRRLSNSVGVHLYRITQEAINNVLKYAEAQAVVIQLMVYDDVIIWSVEDDGKGFDRTEVEEGKHFGLDSMKHRTQMLSGSIEINSHIGRGTTIAIEIPVKKHYFYEENTYSDR